MHQIIRVNTIFKFGIFSLILLAVTILCLTSSYAQENQLIIDLDSTNIQENTNFLISVYNITEDLEQHYQTNVSIEFNGKEFFITEDDYNLEKTISAPSVDSDKNFLIKASKEGFLPAYENVTILDTSFLVINPESYVIDAGKRFSVKITRNNLSGIEVEGVVVAIENVIGKKYTDITDPNGRAYLTAPTNKEKITIIANKTGFADGKINLEINVSPSLIDQIIQNENFIIFLAVIFLIIAVLFVNFRQKKSLYYRAKEISDDKQMKKYGADKKTSVYDVSKSDIDTESNNKNKIEEIRIVRSRNPKDVIPVKPNEKREINEEKKSPGWFKGTDEVKYEIDRLTGEVDEEGKDKWFEGVENLRDKLDEKMKKKGKKEEGEDGKKE